MPRRRRSHPIHPQSQPVTTAAMTHATAPAVVRQDLLRVAFIYVALLALLGGVAYWQQQSDLPTQIGHALRLFVGF